LLGDFGATEELHGHRSGRFWQATGDVAPLLSDSSASIWRISVPPAKASALVAALKAAVNFDYYYDWGGGLIWLSTKQADAHEAIRSGIKPGEGHASLIRASDTLRAAVPVFQPQPEALAALSRRLREQFDPKGILNPGRMGG
jgi:glycolate oxidase FAD binding subunit